MYNEPDGTQDEEVLRIAQTFSDNPQDAGKALSNIGRERGYHVISDTIHTLWDSCIEQTEKEIVAFLHQPEWVWRVWAEDESVFVAGIVCSKTGKFTPVGFCEEGDMEVSVFSTLDMSEDHSDILYLPNEVPDPRPSTQPKLCRKKDNFFFVLVGEIADLIKAGYSAAQIVPTEGEGALGQYQAYVLREGPESNAQSIQTTYIDCAVNTVQTN